MISDGLKKPIAPEEILSKKIKLSYLKRIDKYFNQGLHYYLDPKTPVESKEASVFFRKDRFNTELNFGARKIVNEFEEFKISLSAIAKLADLNLERAFPLYNLNDNPKHVANSVRNKLYPEFTPDLRGFLKSLISKFAENNILVFEFVETWNKKDKANIDGFFLNPNVIVLKRNQIAFRREIFTLIHELGHFLLGEEEIDKIDYQELSKSNLSSVERWCNDFAYYFLGGKHADIIDSIEYADSSNDYHFDIIEKVSKITHLSQIALFTKLLYYKKLSHDDYRKIKQDFEDRYQAKLENKLKQQELDKQKGIPQEGSTPQPIRSPLLISTIQTAFYEGILNEYEVCQRLKIQPKHIDKYIS